MPPSLAHLSKLDALGYGLYSKAEGAAGLTPNSQMHASLHSALVNCRTGVPGWQCKGGSLHAAGLALQPTAFVHACAAGCRAAELCTQDGIIAGHQAQRCNYLLHVMVLAAATAPLADGVSHMLLCTWCACSLGTCFLRSIGL